MHNPFSTYSDTHIMHNPGLCKMCATDRQESGEGRKKKKSLGPSSHTCGKRIIGVDYDLPIWSHNVQFVYFFTCVSLVPHTFLYVFLHTWG